MKAIQNALYLFAVIPLMLARAVILNGMFGNRSVEDWIVAGFLYVISLTIVSNIFWTGLVIGSLSWLWCVFIWFVYRLACDRGIYSEFLADLRGLVKPSNHNRTGGGFMDLLPSRYLTCVFLFWHLSFASITLFLGIQLLFNASGKY